MIVGDRALAVNAEVEIPFDLCSNPKGIRNVDGMRTWGTIVPANGEVSFEFALKLARQK